MNNAKNQEEINPLLISSHLVVREVVFGGPYGLEAETLRLISHGQHITVNIAIGACMSRVLEAKTDADMYMASPL